MWKCPSCQVSIEEPFEICWNCGTSKDGEEDPSFNAPNQELTTVYGSGQNKDSDEAHATPQTTENVLADIVEMQKRQQETLRDIQSKVGCLYAYLIFSIIIGVLAVAFNLTR